MFMMFEMGVNRRRAIARCRELGGTWYRPGSVIPRLGTRMGEYTCHTAYPARELGFIRVSDAIVRFTFDAKNRVDVIQLIVQGTFDDAIELGRRLRQHYRMDATDLADGRGVYWNLGHMLVSLRHHRRGAILLTAERIHEPVLPGTLL